MTNRIAASNQSNSADQQRSMADSRDALPRLTGEASSIGASGDQPLPKPKTNLRNGTAVATQLLRPDAERQQGRVAVRRARLQLSADASGVEV